MPGNQGSDHQDRQNVPAGIIRVGGGNRWAGGCPSFMRVLICVGGGWVGGWVSMMCACVDSCGMWDW